MNRDELSELLRNVAHYAHELRTRYGTDEPLHAAAMGYLLGMSSLPIDEQQALSHFLRRQTGDAGSGLNERRAAAFQRLLAEPRVKP